MAYTGRHSPSSLHYRIQIRPTVSHSSISPMDNGIRRYGYKKWWLRSVGSICRRICRDSCKIFIKIMKCKICLLDKSQGIPSPVSTFEFPFGRIGSNSPGDIDLSKDHILERCGTWGSGACNPHEYRHWKNIRGARIHSWCLGMHTWDFHSSMASVDRAEIPGAGCDFCMYAFFSKSIFSQNFAFHSMSLPSIYWF